jgi:predicted nucleic acid-binding Zn ribbon protein
LEKAGKCSSGTRHQCNGIFCDKAPTEDKKNCSEYPVEDMRKNRESAD